MLQLQDVTRLNTALPLLINSCLEFRAGRNNNGMMLGINGQFINYPAIKYIKHGIWIEYNDHQYDKTEILYNLNRPLCFKYYYKNVLSQIDICDPHNENIIYQYTYLLGKLIKKMYTNQHELVKNYIVLYRNGKATNKESWYWKHNQSCWNDDPSKKYNSKYTYYDMDFVDQKFVDLLNIIIIDNNVTKKNFVKVTFRDSIFKKNERYYNKYKLVFIEDGEQKIILAE